jgi:hypothetical protein
MTVFNALVLVSHDRECAERFGSQFSERGLAQALTDAAGAEVALTIATLEPQTYAGMPYARDANIHSLHSDQPAPFDRVLSALGAEKVRDILTKNSVGRLINSLSPTDPSRTFARAFRGNPVNTTTHFDLVIASDAGAIRTAWLLYKRCRATAAILGEAAAIAYLRKRG